MGTLALIAASVAAAYHLYVKHPDKPAAIAQRFAMLHRGSLNKWYVDELYGFTLIRPLLFGSKNLLHAIIDVQIIDGMVNGTAAVFRGLSRAYGRFIQVGQVQAYALAIAIGTAVVVLYTVGA